MESDINKAMRVLSTLNISQSVENTGKNELEALAHAIVDLREAGTKLSAFCTQICSGELHTKDEIENIFVEAQTELRHIIYHIADSKYLSHILIPYMNEDN